MADVNNNTNTTTNNNKMRLNPTTPMEYTIFDPAVTVEFVEFVGPEVGKKKQQQHNTCIELENMILNLIKHYDLHKHPLVLLHHTTLFLHPPIQSSPNSRRHHSYALVSPFARTSAYQSSFFYYWLYLIALFVLHVCFHLSIRINLLYFLIIFNYCTQLLLHGGYFWFVLLNYCTCCSLACICLVHCFVLYLSL